MKLIDNFYVDVDNRIQLNTYKIIVRDYKTTDKDEYTDTTYFMNDEQYTEWTENIIPKHQLLELVDKEQLDTSEFVWMRGIELKTDNHARGIEEIASYGSYEAYEASLPESQDEYLLNLDCRIAEIELGIN